MRLRPITDIANTSKIVNTESEGNLQSYKPLDCIFIEDVTNKNTPADIFKGVSKCINQGNFKNGSKLYLIALAYGRFDAKRVEDKTAHQAISALRINHLSRFNKEQTDKFQEALKATLNEKETLCDTLRKIGKPEYYPRYMIQHGMRAFLGNKTKDGLIENFDSDKVWKDVINNYIKCQTH